MRVRYVPPPVGCHDAGDRTDQQVEATSRDGKGTSGEATSPLSVQGRHRHSWARSVSGITMLRLGFMGSRRKCQGKNVV